MSTLGMVVLFAGGIFIAGLTLDVAVNAAQDWYGTVYGDAMWSARVEDTPAMRDLAVEEAEIDRLLHGEDEAEEAPHR